MLSLDLSALLPENHTSLHTDCNSTVIFPFKTFPRSFSARSLPKFPWILGLSLSCSLSALRVFLSFFLSFILSFFLGNHTLFPFRNSERTNTPFSLSLLPRANRFSLPRPLPDSFRRVAAAAASPAAPARACAVPLLVASQDGSGAIPQTCASGLTLSGGILTRALSLVSLRLDLSAHRSVLHVDFTGRFR